MKQINNKKKKKMEFSRFVIFTLVFPSCIGMCDTLLVYYIGWNRP